MIHEKSCGAVVYRIGERGLFFLVEHMIRGHVSIPKFRDDRIEKLTYLR